MIGPVITKSIDSFTIEITDYAGTEQVDISRFGVAGAKPEISFVKGDSAAAAGFLSGLAELMGCLISILEETI
jgi:hypothetical protein